MASWKEYLEKEGYEKLAEAKKLSDILSKDDPEEEPYKSFYQARTLFKDVKKSLKKLVDKRKIDSDFDFVWAAIDLQLGINYMNTEEQGKGEEHIQRCLEKLDQYKLTPQCMGIFQDALNQMGILWTGRRKPEDALDYFKKAEYLHIDYKNAVDIGPWMVEEFLSPPTEDKEKLEYDRWERFASLYTHTLFYFAQVYQQLGKADIAAQYCHFTLQRQLDSLHLDKKDWALQVATLSQYYLSERNFTMARHCLACSEAVFQEYEASLEKPSEDLKEKVDQARADIQRCWIKYSVGLMEYSRDLLVEEATKKAQDDEQSTETGKKNMTPEVTESESKPESAKTKSGKPGSGKSESTKSESLKSEQTETSDGADSAAAVGGEAVEGEVVPEDETDSKQKDEKQENVDKKEEDQDESGKESEHLENKKDYPDSKEGDEESKVEDQEAKEREQALKEKEVQIEMEKKTEERFNLEVTSHEEKITDQPLKTFEDAREMFLHIKKLIEDAKGFYKLDAHCTDYVELVQDHSLSFKFLSFYELDMERQCKMHKRRVDMLAEVLKELNPQHYLLVCRQLMFEIADTYSSMMDLKLAIIEASGKKVKPTTHSLKKINALTMESIKYYQEYLNTLKGGKPVYPDEFPENDVRPGLVAMFCMGRLYSKFIPPDTQTRLLNLKKSKDCYQFLVDYCKKNPSAASLVPSELEICKEMVELLPAKMEKIRLESMR